MKPLVFIAALILSLALVERLRAEDPAEQFELVVVGGTPGGIATAVTAARLGRSVALVEYHRHIGGMSASGLAQATSKTAP